MSSFCSDDSFVTAPALCAICSIVGNHLPIRLAGEPENQKRGDETW